jgi:hypothetical protein
MPPYALQQSTGKWRRQLGPVAGFTLKWRIALRPVGGMLTDQSIAPQAKMMQCTGPGTDVARFGGRNATKWVLLDVTHDLKKKP